MRSRGEIAAARWMVTPTLVVLRVVAGYPLAFALYLSLRRRLLVFSEDRFIGLDNFIFLVRDDRFWSAVSNTTYFTVCAVAVDLVIGVGLAVLIHRATPGHKLLRLAVLVPWAIPTVVSAKMWGWLFHSQYGLIARALPLADHDILGDPTLAMHAAIVVDVWKTVPFVAFLALAGLKTISGDVYRAAALDGVSGWRLLWRIELPILRSTLVVIAALRALDAFRVFDVIYTLTDGGPANTTETVSIYAYKTLMRSGDFGYGSALAIATLVFTAALGLIAARALRREAR